MYAYIYIYTYVWRERERDPLVHMCIHIYIYIYICIMSCLDMYVSNIVLAVLEGFGVQTQILHKTTVQILHPGSFFKYSFQLAFKSWVVSVRFQSLSMTLINILSWIYMSHRRNGKSWKDKIQKRSTTSCLGGFERETPLWLNGFDLFM